MLASLDFIDPLADEPVCFYEHRFYMFSNFSAFTVELDDVVWMTGEHAYQASKFTDAKIRREIELARSAHDAKKIAHKYKNAVRHDWYKRKEWVMERVVRAKHDQHEYIQKMLLETDDRIIVEDSPKDSFWGWGPDRKGLNKLGKIWMKIRTEKKQKAPRH
jgi:ribA/ribD-fused uncharacterized protein